MLKKIALFCFAMVAAAACGGTGTSTTGGGGGHGGGGSPPPPDATYQTTPFEVPAGGDVTMCTYFETTNEEDVFVKRLQIDQGTGHHVVLYRMDHAVAPHSEPCPQGGQMNEINLAVAQLGTNGVEFPDGVGLPLSKHSQLVAEVHMINASAAPVDAGASIEMFYAAPGTVTQQANVYYVGSMNIDSKPQSTSSAHGSCSPPFPLVLRSGMGHEHIGGTGVHVDVLRAGGGAEHLYDATSWDDAPVKEWGDAGVSVGATDKIDVRCDYTNTGTAELGYPHQMCWFLGYHWGGGAPNVGFYCMSAGGGADDACTCIPYGAGDGLGGSTLEITVSRAASALGPSTRPVYCFAYAEGATSPSYYGNAIDDVDLAADTDAIKISIPDISPGTFSITCIQDDVYGGVLPGSGDAASSAPPTVMVPTGGTATVSVALDVAVP